MSSLKVHVSSPDTFSERTYDANLTIGHLKVQVDSAPAQQKLESVTGISPGSQILVLCQSESDETVIKQLDDESASLASYGVQDWNLIKVSDKNPATSLAGQFTDVSQVEKFELSKEDYEQRRDLAPDTVLQYKKQHKMGRFAPSAEQGSEVPAQASSHHIVIGSRCEVSLTGEDGFKRRGTVRFVGPTKFGKGGVRPPMSRVQKEHIIISNGEKVHVNDHVYVSPPWELRDGIPYSIARIMEFLPAESTEVAVHTGDSKGKGKEKEPITRVRLAWYYRPSDLSDRAVADSRLLLAAIFSEVQPVSFLRAKCHVKHRDKIADLNGWRRRPDRFYFTKLFDPYIKKEYEVIRSIDIHNRELSFSPFELSILAHVERRTSSLPQFVPEFTPHFAVPQHIKEVLQSRYEFVITEKEVVSDLTDALRECDTCSQWCPAPESVQCDLCKHFFHMLCVQPPLAAKPAKGYGWTCAPCTLHHEERVDRKLHRSTTPVKQSRHSASAKHKGKTGDGPKTRVMPTEDKYFKMWPYRYFGYYTVAEDTLDPDDMIFPRAATRVGPKYQCTIPKYLGPASPDVAPSGLENYNAELFTIASEIEGRTTAEVVKFYGWWKNDRLKEENQRIREASGPISAAAPTKFRRTVSVRTSTDPDDEGSVVNGQLENDPSVKAALFCGSCKTKDSTVWWKGPKGLPSPVMCDACGIAWRKYGDIKGPPKQDEPQNKKPINGHAEKREGTPLPPPPPKRQKVYSPRFMKDTAYGVSKEDVVVEPWLCEVCANEKHQEFALVADCLLCPRPPFASPPPPAKGSSGEFLRAWKPTEGRGWVHAICSIFIPEIQYTDATRLRYVEGMSSLPAWRWKEPCSFCKQTGGGAVVKCPDCPMKFHLSCAWRNQLRFGFELTPKQVRQPGDPPLITFRSVVGILEPFVWCNAHILEQNRIVWGPCDASEGETALQMYCRNYKQVPLEHSYGLLRRAYRVDQALAIPPSVPTADTTQTQDKCTKCGTSYSPYFWPVHGVARNGTLKPPVLCHKCHYHETQMNGIKEEPPSNTTALLNGIHHSDPPSRPVVASSVHTPNGVALSSSVAHVTEL
ncbi:putative PHD type zinc finger protein with BAH domain-containing protein [Tulasnella sp. 403]|nr:putative PHD type zinc finger protein with BAH domain-containing protein [Tulasnella sp. 403]